MGRRRYSPDNEGPVHLAAKLRLYEWLVARDKIDGILRPFVWTPGNWGVHMELPFYENSSQYYFEFPETHTGLILFRPDICVFHKGTPTLIIEVVHTNAVSAEKLDKIERFFYGFLLEVWEVSTTDILIHWNEPSAIRGRCILRI